MPYGNDPGDIFYEGKERITPNIRDTVPQKYLGIYDNELQPYALRCYRDPLEDEVCRVVRQTRVPMTRDINLRDVDQ